ncbi:hypothetical protein JCM30471_22560 [Desulfuromonas carbonis]|uniref:hypothetical protein n=1 Tax=Desulfuromonas sp. DDH964 TaxID=1823759 RepID=UPI00078D268F|nr:hypothetical protein [Desulfuromonas sp. DDH964]AMV73836.1 hypothetical protein DBW_3538 [Desulfuromonas sp. DDH964]
MLQRIKQAVRRDNKSILLAALFSGGLFVGKIPAVVAAPNLIARQSFLTLLLFCGLFATFRLFSTAVASHVNLEMTDGEESNRQLVRLFVIYKEVVKVVVGVSLSLGWLAGLLFISEHFREMFLLVPVLLGGGLTALLSALAYGFTSFVDHIHYPH